MKVLWLSVLAALAFGAGENPIRRIVLLLQGMQTEIEGEGDRSKKMYEKYMCFCDTNIGQTETEIQDASELVSRLETSIKELSSASAQLDSEIAELVTEIEDNRKSVEEQTGVRKEEAQKFLDESTETKNAIASIDKALPALEKGLSLTQTVELLTALQPLVKNTPHEDEMHSLLQETQHSGTTTGSADQIIGILKQMSDNFKANLKDIIQDEEASIKEYDELMKSKNTEFQSANNEMNARKDRRASNGAKASASKLELEKVRNALRTNQDRILDLRKGCADRTKEHDASTKQRQAELSGIGQAVKVLNDDSALDLFKKTLPSPQLLQAPTDADPAAQVWELLQGPAPSLVQLSLRAGAKPGFGPVLKLVGNMKHDLAKQQDDDDSQRDFCNEEIARNENVLTEKNGQIKLLEQELAEMTNDHKALHDSLSTIETEVAKLDQGLEEARHRREEEKSEYTKVSSEQSQAIALIAKAKEVLAGVYGPKAALVQQKADPNADIEGMLGLSFVQTGDKQFDALLLEVGEDAGLTSANYQPKTAQGAGVMAMMDAMKHDVELELAELHHDEEEQQADYDKLEADTGAANRDKQKEITAKKEAVARLDELIAIRKTAVGGYGEEVATINDKLAALHQQCDFLVENYEQRKKVRAQEVEGLSQSEAVLRGAKLDLAQRALRH